MAKYKSEAVVVIEENDGHETVWVEVDGRVLPGRVIRMAEPARSYRGARDVEIQTRSGLRLCKDVAAERLAIVWPFVLSPSDLAGRSAAIETMVGEEMA